MSDADLQRLFDDADAAKAAGDGEQTAALLRRALEHPELETLFTRGSVVDELVDVYAMSGQHAAGHALIDEAATKGWFAPEYAEMRHAGMLLAEGDIEQGSARYDALRGDAVDDVFLLYDAGIRLADAGRHELAARWLADGIRGAIAEEDESGLLEEILEARAASLEALEQPLDEVQHEGVAHLRRHARYQPPPQQQVHPAVAFFPRSEHEKARRVWPDLADVLGEQYADYVPVVEQQLRRVSNLGLRPVLAPLLIDEYLAWTQEREVDAGAANVRAAYAAQLMADGRGHTWPPSRNAPCWCGSGAKYKKCCGAG